MIGLTCAKLVRTWLFVDAVEGLAEVVWYQFCGGDVW
jgi:hypothetical protein